MKGLKEAIKEAERRAEQIRILSEVSKAVYSHKNLSIQVAAVQSFRDFTSVERDQVCDLLNRFISRRTMEAAPLQEKLNTLSTLIEDKA